MNFEIRDDTDHALVKTLVHEMYLCRKGFDEFVAFTAMADAEPQCKAHRIGQYSAYAEFVHHLYEFYVGCFKRDRRNTENIRHAELDQLLNAEVYKLLRNKRLAIENGYAPSWENHISVYQVPVPEEFGSVFRKARNRAAHSEFRRAVSHSELTLAQFCKEYHFFMYLLYESCLAFWHIQDIEKIDLGSISEFDPWNLS
jgi:hypothetical protein